MKEVVALPPMFDRIDEVFHIKDKPVIFTWGDTIYNPMAILISPALKAHEGVHYSRQTNDTAKIEAWWESYLIDPEFRLAEELPAHRAEYKNFRQFHPHFQHRKAYLDAVSARLAGPIYANLITESKARALISA